MGKSMKESKPEPSMIDQVFLWRKSFGRKDPEVPTYEERSVYAEELKLIDEEYEELEAAIFKGDKVKILDSILDLIWVILGLACKLGYKNIFARGWFLVTKANLSKFWTEKEKVTYEKFIGDRTDAYTFKPGPRGFYVAYDSNNKVMKPPSFTPPDMELEALI